MRTFYIILLILPVKGWQNRTYSKSQSRCKAKDSFKPYKYKIQTHQTHRESVAGSYKTDQLLHLQGSINHYKLKRDFGFPLFIHVPLPVCRSASSLKETTNNGISF